MKAIVIDGYGGSDLLRLDERPEPRPSAGEILVKVHASGVNPVDRKIRRGDLRLILWLRFPYIPGGDIAGEVVAVGPGVTRFKPGDAVVAFVDLKRGGGYAELAVVKESAAAPKPGSLSFAEAASLPIAGVTPLQALRDVGGLKDGGSALINGGAGGVGHFAVQIARALSATVTATCGPSSVAFVESLGADTVIDYSREDFTHRPERYDVVFDAVAKSSFPACHHLLKPGGTYVTTAPGPGFFVSAAVQSAAGLFGRAKRARFLVVRREGSDLAFLGQLADQGRLRPTLGRTYPLERAREAHDESERGHVRGKIVLKVGS
ncbi:MAG: NAD(P)-dependent alcohol dehydrogenase [Isosphaeraceae bacterium]